MFVNLSICFWPASSHLLNGSVDCFTSYFIHHTGSSSSTVNMLPHFTRARYKLVLHLCSALALAGKVFLPSPSPRALLHLPSPSGSGLTNLLLFFFTFSISLSADPSLCLENCRLSSQSYPLIQCTPSGKLGSTGSLSLGIKFDWNIAMLICLYIAYAEQQVVE